MRNQSTVCPVAHRSTGIFARRGVTVIELLVAVGVTALLVSMMLGIVVNITGGWNRSSGSLESGNQARVVLDQLTSDLQAAIIKNDNNTWIAATLGPSAMSPGWEASGAGQNTPAIPNGTTPPLPNLEDYRFGPYGVWFRFFSTVPGTNDDPTTLSAPRAVAYQIVRRAVVDGSTERRYQLHRSEVSPDQTFTTGYNIKHADYTGGASGNAPGSIRNPDRNSVIANNVVDFGVRILDASGNILFPLNATSDYAVTAGSTAPDSIEIFVRILSVEGAQQLALLENPPTGYTPTGTWWEVVEANSRVYTRRVDLKAKAL